MDVFGCGELHSLFNYLISNQCFSRRKPCSVLRRHLRGLWRAAAGSCSGLLVRYVLKFSNVLVGELLHEFPLHPPSPPFSLNPPLCSAHRHRVCTSAVNFLQKASQLYLSLESSRRRRSHALINVPACFAALVYSETKVEKAPLDLLSAVNLKLKHRGLCVIAG